MGNRLAAGLILSLHPFGSGVAPAAILITLLYALVKEVQRLRRKGKLETLRSGVAFSASFAISMVVRHLFASTILQSGDPTLLLIPGLGAAVPLFLT